jgi:hypothetical protein
MSQDSERQASLDLVMKGAAHKSQAQRARNEAKRAERTRKSQLAENLKGPGPLRHVSKGSVFALQSVWQELFLAYHPGLIIAPWFVKEDGKNKAGKEASLTAKLVQRYPASVVEAYFRYVFREWSRVRERFPKSPIVPTVGWLFVMAETLVPEAQQPAPAPTTTTNPAVEELKRWFHEHPGEVSPPAELMARIPLGFNFSEGV